LHSCWIVLPSHSKLAQHHQRQQPKLSRHVEHCGIGSTPPCAAQPAIGQGGRHTLCTIIAILIAEAFVTARATNSNTAKRYWLPTTSGAVYLDGSPAAYYVKREAESTKWVLWQQGGGWCHTDAECLTRSRGTLGSSRSYPATLELFSRNASLGTAFEQLSNIPIVNPFLYNFSKIFLPYGDGTSQISDLDGPVHVGRAAIFYRGARVLRSLISALSKTILADATDVIVGGSSAGALSAYLHVDKWAAALPNARVVALPDSGFFLNYRSSSKGFSDNMVRIVVVRTRGGSAVDFLLCRSFVPRVLLSTPPECTPLPQHCSEQMALVASLRPAKQLCRKQMHRSASLQRWPLAPSPRLFLL
jgi:O-palmitoleoyl-L-serine hydrolase